MEGGEKLRDGEVRGRGAGGGGADIIYFWQMNELWNPSLSHHYSNHLNSRGARSCGAGPPGELSLKQGKPGCAGSGAGSGAGAVATPPPQPPPKHLPADWAGPPSQGGQGLP